MADTKPAGSPPAETITTKKERDYMFDTFRGILIRILSVISSVSGEMTWMYRHFLLSGEECVTRS